MFVIQEKQILHPRTPHHPLLQGIFKFKILCRLLKRSFTSNQFYWKTHFFVCFTNTTTKSICFRKSPRKQFAPWLEEKVFCFFRFFLLAAGMNPIQKRAVNWCLTMISFRCGQCRPFKGKMIFEGTLVEGKFFFNKKDNFWFHYLLNFEGTTSNFWRKSFFNERLKKLFWSNDIWGVEKSILKERYSKHQPRPPPFKGWGWTRSLRQKRNFCFSSRLLEAKFDMKPNGFSVRFVNTFTLEKDLQKDLFLA